MLNPNELSNYREGIGLGRSCLTAAKKDDMDALFQNIALHSDHPEVIEAALLFVSMLCGGILNELMDDDEWASFLLKEREEDDTKG